MRTLSNLNQEDLNFLKIQWLAQVGDLEKRITARTVRLDKKIARSEQQVNIMASLETALQDAQNILDDMVNNSLQAENIANQEAAVARLQQEYDEERTDTNSLNPQDVQLEVVEIQSLEKTVILLQETIVEIDTLLAA